jgi:hypothetical protein
LPAHFAYSRHPLSIPKLPAYSPSIGIRTVFPVFEQIESVLGAIMRGIEKLFELSIGHSVLIGMHLLSGSLEAGDGPHSGAAGCSFGRAGAPRPRTARHAAARLHHINDISGRCSSHARNQGRSIRLSAEEHAPQGSPGYDSRGLCRKAHHSAGNCIWSRPAYGR